MSCECEGAQYDGSGLPVDGLAALRDRCAALAELLLPDDAWQVVTTAERAGPGAAQHRSYVVLAYERGCLQHITLPIHQFLFDGVRMRDEVTQQYRQDLAERWLVEADEVARHERFRKFFGKVVELQVAKWMATQRWRVIGLEALGAAADIVAESLSGRTYSLEVKYIGQNTSDFLRVMEALAGRAAFDTAPVYSPPNYLLFRVYEAARRLSRCQGPRAVVVVINALAWHSFALPLRNHWIRWEAPVFLPPDDDWTAFLNGQRARYPNLEAEMATLVPSLDQLWIMRVTGEYEYSLEYQRCAEGA